MYCEALCLGDVDSRAWGAFDTIFILVTIILCVHGLDNEEVPVLGVDGRGGEYMK